MSEEAAVRRPVVPMNLLVVDDEQSIRETCAAVAEQCGMKVIAVSTAEEALEVLEHSAVDILLTDEIHQHLLHATRLDAVVTSLAVYAPVVVVGTGKQQGELSALIAAGAADYVVREEGCLPVALGLIQRRLREAQHFAGRTPEQFQYGEEDFGELLRHELNNPLTGILGNAELLLVDIQRKSDGKLPQSGRQRLETIAALAVRLRETVRRLSQEWEARHHPVP